MNTSKFYMKTSIFLIGITLITILIITPQKINAYVGTVPASADARIDQASPNDNQGTADLWVSGGGGFDWDRRILILFDLSFLPSGSTINSAALHLFYFSQGADPGGRTYNAYRITAPWIEGDQIDGVTWAEANHITTAHPGSCTDWTDGGDYTTANGASSTVPASMSTTMTWIVTDIVQDWADGAPNYGFLILDATGGATWDTARFFSRETPLGAIGHNPILKIDWSPPPKAVGGTLTPVNKLVIIAPYVAFVGLVAALSTVYLKQIRKK